MLPNNLIHMPFNQSAIYNYQILDISPLTPIIHGGQKLSLRKSKTLLTSPLQAIVQRTACHSQYFGGNPLIIFSPV